MIRKQTDTSTITSRGASSCSLRSSARRLIHSLSGMEIATRRKVASPASINHRKHLLYVAERWNHRHWIRVFPAGFGDMKTPIEGERCGENARYRKSITRVREREEAKRSKKAQIESQQEVKRSTKIFILIELTAKLPAKPFPCHESLFGHFSSVIFALSERCKNTPVMTIAQEWSLTWFTSSEKSS